MEERTIAAISTPSGTGGISIVRMSGSKAYEIIRKLNAELDKMGKITLSGKVPRAFYEFKTYGGTE